MCSNINIVGTTCQQINNKNRKDVHFNGNHRRKIEKSKF